MKHIVMIQGMGNNERGWAKIMSQYGRVTLIQVGLVEHVEIWVHGSCRYSGAQISTIRYLSLDRAVFGSITVLRVLRILLKFTRKKNIDVILGAAYSHGLLALLLRRLGKTRKVISLLTDYLPPQGSFPVRIHRQIVEALTGFVAKNADQTWAISPRIKAAQTNASHFVVPICINHIQSLPEPRTEIGYIGFPSADHALEIAFRICAKHGIRLNIIGHSPYLEKIRHLAPPGTKFHGVVNEEERIASIFSRCFCGYGVYRQTGPASYSYYGFPSKTLYYLASNVPVVISNTAHFNENFAKFSLGKLVAPVYDEIERAVLELRRNYLAFSDAIDRFRVDWNNQVTEFHDHRMQELLND